MKTQETMPLGVVVERRKSTSRWAEYAWRAVAVIPGAPAVDDWTLLQAGADWVRYHAATLPLELFRKETEGYRYNLSCEPPMVYVVLREGDEAGDHDLAPALVTVCPYEAQDYLDTGEDQVEAVVMPDAVRAWVAAFVDRHHVDEPFEKRRRKRWTEEQGNGEAPPPRRGIRRGYGDG